MSELSPDPMPTFQKTAPTKRGIKGPKALKLVRIITFSVALILLAVKSCQVQLLFRDASFNMQRSTSVKDSSSTVDKSQEMTLSPISAHENQRTLLLLMLFQDDDYQQGRVNELHQTFGTNFYVVWGGQRFDADANRTVAATCPYGPPIQCIDHTQVVISASHQFSHMCCLQEMAIMWALLHRHTFGNVWFMEDDVHYTHVSVLQNIMTFNDDLDFVHQGRTQQLWTEGMWGHVREAREQSKGVFGNTPLHRGLFNLFRLSHRFLDALSLTYRMLDQEWVFFEALLPTVEKHYRLSSGIWHPVTVAAATNVSSNATNSTTPVKQMLYRPCFTSFPEPGIYHPAKYRHGEFREC